MLLLGHGHADGTDEVSHLRLQTGSVGQARPKVSTVPDLLRKGHVFGALACLYSEPTSIRFEWKRSTLKPAEYCRAERLMTVDN